MKNLLYPSLAAAVLGLAVAAPAAAQERVGVNRYAITLSGVEVHPATPKAARRTLARLSQAALGVCGAVPFSLREVTLSIRRSDCWRESMDDVVTRIGDPLVAQIYKSTY